MNNLKQHQWSIGGRWQINDESMQSLEPNTKLRFNFSAKEVYVVMSGPPGSLIDVSVEGLSAPGGSDVNASGQVRIDGARLYRLVRAESRLSNKPLQLTFPVGVTVNAFTFGD